MKNPLGEHVTQTSFKLGEYVTQDTHRTPDVLYTSREGRIYKGEVILLRNERVARERDRVFGRFAQPRGSGEN